MTTVLYHAPRSAPCRAVRLLARALGVQLNLKPIETLKGETRTPEFLKMNPQHCIPTIVDNGYVLWESHAILGYLADKYSKDDSLYPKDVNKRGLVNNRLFFDIGTLYAGFFGYYVPVLRTGKLGDPSFKTKIDEGFELLNTFLEGENWVAGSNLTIADYSIVATVASFDVLGYEVNKWKNVSEWYKRAQQTMAGYDEINGEGCRILKQFFDQLLK